MKTALGILVLLVVLFLGFAHFHSKSIDRAQFINSANALLIAQNHLRQQGAMATVNSQTRIYAFTNRVTMGELVFNCELAAEVPGFANAGSLTATADGTLLWIDLRSGPSIVRRPDGPIVIPERFRDY